MSFLAFRNDSVVAPQTDHLAFDHQLEPSHVDMRAKRKMFAVRAATLYKRLSNHSKRVSQWMRRNILRPKVESVKFYSTMRKDGVSLVESIEKFLKDLNGSSLSSVSRTSLQDEIERRTVVYIVIPPLLPPYLFKIVGKMKKDRTTSNIYNRTYLHYSLFSQHF